ncbi:protein mono-ADP-ribosyltransferase PARP4-like [Pongo pygmaeus]|uniref:protein mono-ADP-ribosyltransferase PARP4-like n=1 Tax=Pongo pygmaeus TaxID=9600 RepID=UPI00300D6C24
MVSKGFLVMQMKSGRQQLSERIEAPLMIHKLATRDLIRDYKDGILHENETSHEMKKQTLKSLIIKLSKENSLIIQFTSFMAVEKRDENESPFPDIRKVSELIAKEDVDFLPYMSWQGEPQGAVRNQVNADYQIS